MDTTDDLTKYGCGRCWHDEVDQAWPLLRETKRIAEIIDKSHFGVSISECVQCGQRFLWVFTETVDWVDGDDPQRLVVMPISAEEQSELRRVDAREIEAHLVQMGYKRRSYYWDHPKGQPARESWTLGITVGRHD